MIWPHPARHCRPGGLAARLIILMPASRRSLVDMVLRCEISPTHATFGHHKAGHGNGTQRRASARGKEDTRSMPLVFFRAEVVVVGHAGGWLRACCCSCRSSWSSASRGSAVPAYDLVASQQTHERIRNCQSEFFFSPSCLSGQLPVMRCFRTTTETFSSFRWLMVRSCRDS